MKLIASLLCSLACAGPWAVAQPTLATASPLPVAAAATEGFEATRLARLPAFLQTATDARGYLGAVMLIARHGKLVQWQAVGSRDLARREPMARDAIFRLYSMTKPIASVAALMLVEEGRLGLDDPVARHLPAFANLRLFGDGTVGAPARTLTIRHLLTHTAGFATGGGLDAGFDAATRLLTRADLPQSVDLNDFATRVAGVPLGAEPGTRFGYDGVNTEVLARVVEVASGERFDAFLQRRIFAPLRMVDTGFAVPPDARTRIAAITTMGPDNVLVALPGPQTRLPGESLRAYPSGAGGLYSTGPDYLRFCQMLLNGGTLDGAQLLKRETVMLMMQDQLASMTPPLAGPTSLATGEGFGLGGSVVTDPARRGRRASLGAFGWSGAASTYFTIDPKEGMIAILLLQHLPRDDVADLPKLGSPFYNLVYQALE